MMRLYAKKKILPSWSISPEDPWGVFRNIRSSESPQSEPMNPTGGSFVQSVVSEQKSDRTNEIIYSTLVLGSCVLIFLFVAALIFIKRRRSKNSDKTGSVLVFPSNQGNTPHFLTKDINFSLPPLRSSSLGNLNEASNSIEDSDVDTECLLLPTVQNQRSNSFSCYGLGVIEPALYKSTLDLDEIQWPEGHIGRLWFSLRYEPSTEKLLVSLLKAKNLPSRTVGTVNSCDPFIRLHLLPDERRYLQSKPKKKTCNPYFDETLVFQVSSKEMTERILKLTVIDAGRTKRRCEIGHITYPLKDLDVGDGSEQQLFKIDLEKEPQEMKSDLGELLISLVYNENLSRLSVTIIEARRLKRFGAALTGKLDFEKRCLNRNVSKLVLTQMHASETNRGGCP
ncbi:hypothetical protein HHI36_015995 [Cryptolaemus montrouzieri]|uniref:C2 domain-containing protein n=1 Tax=Cryptolaemus montrouzieri TaxID=559131 RepID=A0ABD2N7N5_9CUCU